MDQRGKSRYPSSRGGGQNLQWRQPGNGRVSYQQHSRAPAFSGQFVKIDTDTKFYENEDVEGIHLLTDFDMARQLQIKIGKYANGPIDFFPAMWPVNLSNENINVLEKMPYVMAPKPVGPRFLLYVDSSGNIYLENMTQHIFRVDEDHAIKMPSVTDTILDGIVTREKLNENSPEFGTESAGRLTFVIQDAIRCNGRDLTCLNILERISFVKEEILNPRMDALKKADDLDEAFKLDIVEFKDTSSAEDLLSRGFAERFKYPLRSFVFLPRKKGYTCGTCLDIFHWVEKDSFECSFRLKIPPGSKKSGEAELYVVGRGRVEMCFATITLTDEIRELDDKIIDCDYVDHQWIFTKVRNDRTHPNGRRTVTDKMKTLENPINRDLLLTSLDKSRGRD